MSTAVDLVPAVVECDSEVTVTTTGELTHLCPFVDEIDRGIITISWRSHGYTFELHSLRRYLESFGMSRLTHEALTCHILQELSSVSGVTDVEVSTTWQSASLAVLVVGG